MTFSLRTRLTLSFVSIALMLVFIISILANFMIEKQFREYVIQKMEDRNEEIVYQISQQYTDKWNTDIIADIGMKALEEGLIIRVRDAAGNVVWDANTHNSGLCTQMIEHISRNMTSRYPNWNGSFVERGFPVNYGLNAAGQVEIGYYGPFYFNDVDLDFINTLNMILGWVAVFALLFLLVFGALVSERISGPIEKVINTATMIGKGNYAERSEVKSHTKEIQRLVSSINDLARTLQNQEELRKRLTADVAHELRTPMSTLQGNIEAMIDGVWEPTAERLKSCHDEIKRVNKMIGDLSLLAKFEGENLVLNKTNFDITELVSNIVLNFQSDYRNKGVEISYNGEKEMVYADRDKISQVLVNLVSNGLKYTPEGGRVEITIRGVGDAAEITVKDTGQGIPEEDLPRIFERFYRADKSRNRMTGGSGIGLTIAKAIIEAHGGKITVKSIVDKGTEFTISIPHLRGISINPHTSLIDR